MPIAQSKSTAQSTYLSAGFWARSLVCMVSNTAILERTSQIARYLKCHHGVPKGVSTILEISEHVERGAGRAEQHDLDRKSTRLNSSHVAISYAVFCLKKKKIKRKQR